MGQDFIERGDFLLFPPDSDEEIARSLFEHVVHEGDTIEISIALVEEKQIGQRQERKCPKCFHINIFTSPDSPWICW